MTCDDLWMRLTWWRWRRCDACGRRVWGVYRIKGRAVHWMVRMSLICDRADCPANLGGEEVSP